MIKISNNQPLYQACKNIIGQNKKDTRLWINNLYIKENKFYATDGRGLIIGTIKEIESGYYKPVSVTKKEVILESVDEFPYPETSDVTEMGLHFQFDLLSPRPAAMAIITGLAFNDKYLKIARDLGLHDTYYNDDFIVFKSPDVDFYIMKMRFDKPEVRSI